MEGTIICHPVNVKTMTINVYTGIQQGREPPDAMSLRYADMSLSDLLGRPSLRYTVKNSLYWVHKKTMKFRRKIIIVGTFLLSNN